MNKSKQKIYDNFLMLKALDKVDKEKAIQAISDPYLDGKELSELIECSLMGRIVDKKTNEPLQLSNEVLMAGLRNKMNQVIRDSEAQPEC